MARRSKKAPRWAIIAILVILLLAGGAYVFLGFMVTPYRTIAPFPEKDYVQNSVSLQGNIYRLQGQIAAQIFWREDVGRLISVETKDGPIAVLFPATTGAKNLERGQKILAKVIVGEKGILSALEYKKE